MNFPSHLSFGLFTGLLTYYLTQNIIAALIMFIIQIMLILDFLFKKLIAFEPLHTILALIGTWIVAFLIAPAYHWYVLLAYGSHLFLDLFVEEEIPLLYPSKKQLTYPIKKSEKYVLITSITGSAVILLILIA